MKIVIDLRSLSTGTISGVENYCLQVVEHLLPLDKKNEYSLFYNAWQKQALPDFHYINSSWRYTRLPSKFLNLALKFNFVKLEKLAVKNQAGPNIVFMPNLGQFSIEPETKLAVTVHDLSPVVVPEFYDLKRRLWHRFLGYRKAFARADLIFAVSENTKRDLMRLYDVPAEKIRVVYPGIDRKFFHPNLKPQVLRQVRNLYGLPGEFVLFLNTIEPRKNLANLIRAFELLPGPASLVVAGRPGWKYAKIFRQIKRSPKAGKIHYIGYVAEEHKPALLKLARALVYPSFYEGFGFQPLEAMAVGTPAVVSQVTALAEVAGEAALLVNPYNVQDLAQALDLVLTDEPLRQRLISRGLKRALDFDWDLASQRILSGLNSLTV